MKTTTMALLVWGALAVAASGCGDGDTAAAAEGGGGGDTADAPGAGEPTPPHADATEGEAADSEGGGGQPGPGGDAGAGTDTGGDSTAQPTAPERCHSGIDEDGDGLTDCEDPDCAGYEHCFPGGCSNGIDDDGNGLTDCADPNCLREPPCYRENGVLYVYCMVERGCDCEIGTSCPDTNPAFSNCQAACQTDTFCPGRCLDEMPLPVVQGYYAYVACFQDHCGGLRSPEESNACFTEHCLDSYLDWLLTDEQDCAGFFACNEGCAQSASCLNRCYGLMTSEGVLDLTAYFDCQLGLCDGTGDGQADSGVCATMAFWACLDAGGSCFDRSQMVADASCASLMDCVVACDGQVPPAWGECVFGCAALLDQAQLPELAALTQCAVQACGTVPPALSLPCMQEALTDTCALEYALCGGDVELVEICDDGVDNDLDGLVDCEDPDCDGSEHCPYPIELCVQDLLEECEETTALTPGVALDAVGFFDTGVSLRWPQGVQESGAPVCSEAPPPLTLDPLVALGGEPAYLDGRTACFRFDLGAAPHGSFAVFIAPASDPQPFAVSWRVLAPGEPLQPLGQATSTATFPLPASR